VRSPLAKADVRPIPLSLDQLDQALWWAPGEA
jgi:hypothetical protein